MQKKQTCNFLVTIAINFISSKHTNEERVIHSKSFNTEIMINDKEDEAIEEVVVTLSLIMFSYYIMF